MQTEEIRWFRWHRLSELWPYRRLNICWCWYQLYQEQTKSLSCFLSKQKKTQQQQFEAKVCKAPRLNNKLPFRTRTAYSATVSFVEGRIPCQLRTAYWGTPEPETKFPACYVASIILHLHITKTFWKEYGSSKDNWRIIKNVAFSHSSRFEGSLVPTKPVGCLLKNNAKRTVFLAKRCSSLPWESAWNGHWDMDTPWNTSTKPSDVLCKMCFVALLHEIFAYFMILNFSLLLYTSHMHLGTNYKACFIVNTTKD